MSIRAISEWQKSVHENSAAHGFWDLLKPEEDSNVIPSKLALIHAEVSEALEAFREPNFNPRVTTFEPDGKPEGFGIVHGTAASTSPAPTTVEKCSECGGNGMEGFECNGDTATCLACHGTGRAEVKR